MNQFISTVWGVVTALGLCLGFASTAVAASQDTPPNLALHKPYYLLPAPSYWACLDEDDATQLTDGRRAAKGWMDKLTVGWSEGGRRVAVLIDLGKLETFDTITLSTMRGPFANVFPPLSLSVYSSHNAAVFDHLADFKPDQYEQVNKKIFEHEDGQSVDHLLLQVSNLNDRARYVLIVMDRGNFLFLDEVYISRQSASSPVRPRLSSPRSLTNAQITAQFLGVPIVFDPSVSPYQTPHWAQASALAGGPIKALAVTPVSTSRDLAELQQRLELSLRTIATDEGPNTPINGLLQVRIDTALKDDQPQVLILSGTRWDRLSSSLRERIINTVRSGMGLVITDPKLTAEQFAKHGLPLAMGSESERISLEPHQHDGVKTSVHRLGSGRVILLDYQGRTDGQSHTLIPKPAGILGTMAGPAYLQHEYHYSLVAHTVRLAANVKPAIKTKPIRITGIGDQPIVLKGVVGGKVQYFVRDQYDTPFHSDTLAVEVDADSVSFKLPVLRGPVLHFLVQTTNAASAVVDWQCIPVKQTPSIQIGDVKSPRSLSGPAGRFVIDVTLQSDSWQQGDQLLIELIDTHGRMVHKSRRELSAGLNGRVSISHPELISRSVTLWLYAMRDEQLVDVRCQRILVQHPRMRNDEFRMDFWSGSNPMLLRHYVDGIYDQTRQLGADAIYATWPLDGLSNFAAQHDIAMVPENVLRIVEEEGSTQQIRVPTLGTPSFKERLRGKIQQAVEKFEPYGIDLISLGDECQLASSPDNDRSPEALALFADWLAAKYRDIETLNRALGTDHETFTDAVPPLTEQARKSRQYSLWLNHRLFMFEQFSDTVADAARMFQSLTPRAMFGISGAQLPSVSNGHDYAQLVQSSNAISVYGGFQRELLRSFMHGRHEHTMWSGFDYSYANERYERYNVWAALMHDYKGVALFHQFEQRAHPLFSSGYIGPDLSPHRRAVWLKDTVAQIRDGGLGHLIGSASPNDRAISVMYSTRSMMLMHVSPIHADGYTDSATLYLDAVGGVCDGLEDLQHPYRLIDESQIESLRFGEVKVLILPMIVSISDRALTVIDEFVRAGGAVIVGMNLGRFDEHGMPRSAESLAQLIGSQIPAVDRLESASTFDSQSVVSGKGRWQLLGYSLYDYAPSIMGGAGGELLIKQQVADRQAVLRRNFARDIAPIAPVRDLKLADLNGELLNGIEVFPFNGHAGYQYFGVLAEYDEPGKIDAGQPIAVAGQFQQAGHVYELITPQQFGRTGQINFTLREAEARFFAVLPAAVSEIHVNPSQQQRRVELSGHILLENGVEPGHHAVQVIVHDSGGQERWEYGCVMIARDGSFTHSFELSSNDLSGHWSIVVRDTISQKDVKLKLLVE